jgi:hypothetical protein
MRIPANPDKRQEFIQKVTEQCLSSREERVAQYKTLKNFYLNGHDGTAEPASVVNKIFSYLDMVSSFMYSQDTTRFSVELGKSVSDLELGKVPALNEEVNDVWHASNTDILFGNALDWSFVYGSMFIKSIPKGEEIKPFIVEPHNIGVYREDVIGLTSQEAFVHCYSIPESQLEHDLTVANHKDIDRILKEASFNDEAPTDDSTGPMDQIIVSAINPEVVGEVQLNLNPLLNYVPKILQRMGRMYELYVYDDELRDYRVFTLAHPWVIVYDRPIAKMFLEHDIPFTQICPFPMHDYFWGISACERLIPLQTMRNVRWKQIQHMLNMEASPSKWATGFPGSTEELADASETPNGLLMGSDGIAKLESIKRDMPQDLFAALNYIDERFEDYLGVNNILAGKGEEGVRSEGHASQLLRVGSSRTKRRAMVVEDSLEDLATTYLQIMKRYSTKTYRSDDGSEFLPSQFTDDFIVKVDAHSNSPIFVQDQTQIAFQLFKAKAIDRATLIEMLPVPMKDLLKQRLKTKIEPQEAAAHAEEMKIQAAGGKVASIKKK